MVETLHHAFLDESGGVALFVPGERFLVIAVLITARPRTLEWVLKRARKRFGAALASGEMKAAHSAEKTIRWILATIAQQDVEIVAVIVDKQGIVKPPRDPEDLYRRAAARAIRLCVERWPRLEVTLDRRYTHNHLCRKLEWLIREGIADLEKQAVVLRQIDSNEGERVAGSGFCSLGVVAKVPMGRRQLLAHHRRQGNGRGGHRGQIKQAAQPGPRFQSAGRASQPSFPAHASQRGLSRSPNGRGHQDL